MIITSLSTLIDTANLASVLDWNALLEAEGRMACWDPLHERFLRVMLASVLANQDRRYNLVLRCASLIKVH